MAEQAHEPTTKTEKSASDGAGASASTEGQQTTYTGMAASAAGTAAETATNAAVGVKDTMFSMFGGGGKKEEKKETDEGEVDRSGSAKAVKEKEQATEAREDGEVAQGVSRYLHCLEAHAMLATTLSLYTIMMCRPVADHSYAALL